MSKLVHKGVNQNRLNDTRNRREIVFAREWRDFNRLNPEFLSSLLGREATQEDAETAASVIQYLGTKEGWKNLQEILKKCIGMIKI